MLQSSIAYRRRQAAMMVKVELLQQITSCLDETVLSPRHVVPSSVPHVEGLPRASWQSRGVIIIIFFFTTGKISNYALGDSHGFDR